jgi:hypothetical protein
MEDIIISVPKDWDDARKDEFAKTLQMLHLPDDYRIMITNKMDIKIIDADTMDRLKGNTSNG